MRLSNPIRAFVIKLLIALMVAAGLVAAGLLIPRQDAMSSVASSPLSLSNAAPAGRPLRVETLANDLRAPWSIAFLPDGRALVTERPGRVRLIDADLQLQTAPVYEVPDLLADTKLGLMGLAVDPDFATQPYVYLAYGYRDGDHKRVRVARYRWSDDTLVEPQTLLEGIPAQFNHSGGRLKFAPDKTLFATTGDADQPPTAQDLQSLSGKILRINRDGSIPQDNPFVGRDDARPEIFSYGHRNSQGLDFDPASGKLLTSEHGPNGGDELNWTEAGANYGWPTITHNATSEGLHTPLVQFTPSIAPASGAFYNASLFADLKGDYLVGCLRGEALLRVQLNGDGSIGQIERWLFARYGRIREVAVAPDGAIWLTTSMFDPPEANGAAGYDRVLRVTPAVAGEPIASNAVVLADIPTALPPEIPLGATPEERYAALCASCHGANLRGGSQLGIVGITPRYARTEDEMIAIVANGIPDRGMPAARPLLQDEGSRELARWVWQQREQSQAPAAAP